MIESKEKISELLSLDRSKISYIIDMQEVPAINKEEDADLLTFITYSHFYSEEAECLIKLLNSKYNFDDKQVFKNLPENMKDYAMLYRQETDFLYDLYLNLWNATAGKRVLCISYKDDSFDKKNPSLLGYCLDLTTQGYRGSCHEYLLFFLRPRIRK